MMKLVLDNLTSNKIQDLEKIAEDKIHIRGYDPKHDVPVDYRNPNWFVPFNQIPIKYCPTDRYAYLHKYKKAIKLEKTWESLTGKILDDAYDKFIKKLHNYLNTANLIDTDIMNAFCAFRSDVLAGADSLIEKEESNIINFPKQKTEIKQFRMLLERILRYENTDS